jgi:hypothetical protein
MNWKSLTSQTQIDEFMRLFGQFHDACLKEVHISTGHYVGKDLAMAAPSDEATQGHLLFQRQFHDFSAIELAFEKIVRFNMVPPKKNHCWIIFEATMTLTDELIYWADVSRWSPHDPRCDTATWIAAKSLCWRDASNWMGPKLQYGPMYDKK